MFSKNRKGPALDPEQHEQVEYAQSRIREKKWLYRHFVLFLIGIVFLIGINKILKYGEPYNWYAWVLTAWGFLLAVHTANVFVVNRFLGRDWERAQREKLVCQQRDRIRKLQQEVEAAHPLPAPDKKKEP